MGKFDISNFAAGSPAQVRDIETVTGEVLKLKRQAGNTMIAIGQKLIEAKEMLPHGEWLPWLHDRVEFSERMAQQLMQLAREMTNPQTFADLEPSKVLALLAVPAEEREAFAAQPHNVGGEEKTVKDMSVREIKEAIKQNKKVSCSEIPNSSAERNEEPAPVQQEEPERCEIAAEETMDCCLNNVWTEIPITIVDWLRSATHQRFYSCFDIAIAPHGSGVPGLIQEIRWHTGKPTKAGVYYAKFDIKTGAGATRLAEWSGYNWKFISGATIQVPCIGWCPLPED